MRTVSAKDQNKMGVKNLEKFYFTIFGQEIHYMIQKSE